MVALVIFPVPDVALGLLFAAISKSAFGIDGIGLELAAVFALGGHLLSGVDTARYGKRTADAHKLTT